MLSAYHHTYGLEETIEHRAIQYVALCVNFLLMQKPEGDEIGDVRNDPLFTRGNVAFCVFVLAGIAIVGYGGYCIFKKCHGSSK